MSRFVNRLPQEVIDRYHAEHPEQHTASKEACEGTGQLPRSMGEQLSDGTFTGMCISCMDFHPLEEVVPPSRPEWKREFRLAPHSVQQHTAAKDVPDYPDALEHGHRDQWHPGERAHFEYHCYEGHDSADAQAWYRSHRPVTVLHAIDTDFSRDEFPTFYERAEEGAQHVYHVRHDDGFEHDAFEDELLTHPRHFHRPDPPAPKTASWEGVPFDQRHQEGPRERDTAPEQTPEGHFVFYHGSSRQGAEQIISERMLRPDDLGVVGVGTTRAAVGSFSAMKGRGEDHRLRVTISPDVLARHRMTHEIGGSGHDQFLIHPPHGHRGEWEGVPLVHAERTEEPHTAVSEKPVWLQPGMHEGVDPDEFVRHVRPVHGVDNDYHRSRAFYGEDVGHVTVHLRTHSGPVLWDGNHRVNAAVWAKKDCPSVDHAVCDHGLRVHTLYEQDDPEWQETKRRFRPKG